MAKQPPNFRPLLNYFLHLFQVQVTGEYDKADTLRAVVFSEKPGEDTIYELQLKHRGTYRTRRMSIRSLGEQVESKSMCYKVIYDDLLVVKVPPRPITDFQAYLDHINQEHAIADRLSPAIRCVYPNLGAILKMLPSLRLPSGFTAAQSEKEYISRLTNQPHLQKHLMIGDSFVFFMSLSKYRFFNQVIDSIHKSSDMAQQEIVRNGPVAISDFHAFDMLYGSHNDKIYFDMHDLVKKYENSIEKVLKTSENRISIPDYQKQEWFFSRVAGIKPDGMEDLPVGLPEKIEAVSSRLMKDRQPVIEKYQHIVHARVEQKRFDTNRARIRGLAVNVIELIYRLKNRKVAIRDLKPDNMYIAARLDGADHILADPEAFDLGLIDLETALCFQPGSDGRIPQPLLAGTPTYATPAHIFNNRILHAVYKNELSRVFYLQDWYAAMVMIYYVVTGRLLFIKTARLMPEISRIKKKNARKGENPLNTFHYGNRIFWKTAREEFDYKIRKEKIRLEDVEILLPEHLSDLLKEECKMEAKMLEKWIASEIDSCRSAGRLRERLMTASAEKIRQIMEKLRDNSGPEIGPEDFLRLIKRIEPVKQQIQELNQAAGRLSSDIPCHFLLSFLFDRIYQALYRPYMMKE